MEPFILLIITVIFIFYGNRIADLLFTINMPLYKIIFGTRIEKYGPIIKKVNLWGIRFGAIIFLLMALALVFGPLEI